MLRVIKKAIGVAKFTFVMATVNEITHAVQNVEISEFLQDVISMFATLTF